ncbi:MAG: hypothetical protein FWH54_03600 [Methanobrevibacter sp.]|nr:hypothetical protein [Methanobrevibacter sp.]
MNIDLLSKYFSKKLNKLLDEMIIKQITESILLITLEKFESELKKEGWEQEYIKIANFRFKNCQKTVNYNRNLADGTISVIMGTCTVAVGQVDLVFDVDKLKDLSKNNPDFSTFLSKILS